MVTKINKTKWKELVSQSKKIEITIADLTVVDSNSLKQLRNDLELTQNRLAEILGVSKKTIEKWEQSANPIEGTARRLIYLMMEDHTIIDRLLKVVITNVEK